MQRQRLVESVLKLRTEREARDAAKNHLLIATTAAMTCRNEAGNFDRLTTIAEAVEARGARHGIGRVEVITDSSGATERLAVYLVENESSAAVLHIVVPFDERCFRGCTLRSDGDITFFNGARY